MPPRLMLLSPDGKTLTTASLERDGSKDITVIKQWDLVAGKARVLLQRPTVEMLSLAFSPDGKSVIAGGHEVEGVTSRAIVKRCDLATGTERTLFKGTGQIKCVAWSPDGQMVAAVIHDLLIRVWDAHSGEVRFNLRAGNGTSVARFVGFTRDGKMLITAGRDANQPNTLIRRWSLATETELPPLRDNLDLADVPVLSPDGRMLLTTTWERNSSGTKLVAKLWDLPAGKERGRLPVASAMSPVFTFAPDGLTLASASGEGRLILWETATIHKRHEMEMPGPVSGLAFLPEGRHLLTSNGNGTLYVLRLPELPKPAALPVAANSPLPVHPAPWKPEPLRPLPEGKVSPTPARELPEP
jgi:WD40 repeat protein